MQSGKSLRRVERGVPLASSLARDPDLIQARTDLLSIPQNDNLMEKWFVPLKNINQEKRVDRVLWALIDTGSSKSYIGREGLIAMRGACFIEVSIVPFVVIVANGEHCSVEQAFQFAVLLGNRELKLTLYYLPQLTVPAILGLDRIMEAEMTLNPNSSWNFRGDPDRQYSFFPSPLRSTIPVVAGIQIFNKDEQHRLKSIIERGMKSVRGCPGRTTLIAHRIDTGEARPIKQKAYRYSPKVLEAMYAELDRYLSEGVVEPSHAEWASPVVMVKRDDKYRFCIDYRRVNAVSKKDSYPMPNMSQLLDSLHQARYLSKIDLKQAFLQVPLADEHSRDVTSFIVPGRGLFRFTVMPFGLSGSPTTFQRLADRLFGPELFPYVVVYLDDLLICTPDFDTHCRLVQEVFSRLTAAGLKVNEEKCEFGCSEVRYLGFLVNEAGICADPDRVTSVTDFPVPHNHRTLKRFLGMAGWYRRFIQDFSTLASPLTELLKKNVRWKWGSIQNEAFVRLKTLLTTSPVLARPDFSLPFILNTDASNVGLGAVLTQIQNGLERVIAYSSRTLSKNERNYSVTEKECLAVLWGITKHRYYLEGYRFSVVTDHASLKWLLNLKDPTGRLARWALQLQQYDFEIIYRKGTNNVVADALSRIPEVDAVNTVGTLSALPRDLWYEQKVSRVAESPGEHPDWQVKDGKLFYHRMGSLKGELEDEAEGWKLVVPKVQRGLVLRECHDLPEAGHLGVAKTHWRISRLYYWPGMFQDIRKYVRNCEICQRSKPSNTPPRGLMGERYVQTPWQCVSADLMGPFPHSSDGNCYLLVFQDVFSRWVELIPIRRATSEVISKKFRSVILNRYGAPVTLITDNGSNFVGSLMTSMAKSCNIRMMRTPFYHSQANPVERSNRNIRQLIVSFLNGQHKHWDRYIGEFQLALNSVKQDSTRFSPAFLNFGRELRVGISLRSGDNGDGEVVVENFEGAHERWAQRLAKLKELYHLVEEHVAKANHRQSSRYNLRRSPDRFMPGDKVLKRTSYPSSAGVGVASKLYPKYEGPFEVISVSPSGCCRLRGPDGRSMGCWHPSRLKSYNSEGLDSDRRTPSLGGDVA